MQNELLQVLSNDDLPKLHNLYKRNNDYIVVYNVLTCMTQWSKQCPDNFTIYVTSDWEQTGTFVVILHFYCYQVVVCTLQKSCDVLVEALNISKIISWKHIQMFLMPAEYMFAPLMDILIKKQIRFKSNAPNSPSTIWWMRPEEIENVSIECPPEVYLDNLNPLYISQINSNWRHRFPNSEKYLQVFYEQNGGLGLYEKKTNRLVAWSLTYHFAFGPVQVVEDEKRKGYGSLMAKAIAKHYAAKGFIPAGLVVKDNEASHLMFAKLGFKKNKLALILEMEADYPLCI